MRASSLVVPLAAWFCAGQALAQTVWRRPACRTASPICKAPGRTTAPHRSSGRAELAGKPLLSEDERRGAARRGPREIFGPEADAVFGDALYLALLDDTRPRQTFATGTYSQNWVPNRYFERRTSLIEDPADGRLPPLTPEAVAAARGASRRATRARARRRATSR